MATPGYCRPDDYWSENYNPAAFTTVDPQLPCIAPCYNPDAIENCGTRPAMGAQRPHHGGQVRIPLLGALLPVRTGIHAGLFHLGQRSTSIMALTARIRPTAP